MANEEMASAVDYGQFSLKTYITDSMGDIALKYCADFRKDCKVDFCLNTLDSCRKSIFYLNLKNYPIRETFRDIYFTLKNKEFKVFYDYNDIQEINSYSLYIRELIQPGKQAFDALRDENTNELIHSFERMCLAEYKHLYFDDNDSRKAALKEMFPLITDLLKKLSSQYQKWSCQTIHLYKVQSFRRIEFTCSMKEVPNCFLWIKLHDFDFLLEDGQICLRLGLGYPLNNTLHCFSIHYAKWDKDHDKFLVDIDDISDRENAKTIKNDILAIITNNLEELLERFEGCNDYTMCRETCV